MQEKESRPPLNLGLLANEMEALRSALTMIANLHFYDLVFFHKLSS